MQVESQSIASARTIIVAVTVCGVRAPHRSFLLTRRQAKGNDSRVSEAGLGNATVDGPHQSVGRRHPWEDHEHDTIHQRGGSERTLRAVAKGTHATRYKDHTHDPVYPSPTPEWCLTT